MPPKVLWQLILIVATPAAAKLGQKIADADWKEIGSDISDAIDNVVDVIDSALFSDYLC